MTQTHLQAASWATEVATAIAAQGDARAFDTPLLLRDAAHHIRRLTAVNADLLAACERLVAWDASSGDVALISEACSRARAALAKTLTPGTED